MRELANRIWGDCDGDKVKSHNFGKGRVLWNVPLKEILTGMGVERDFVPEGIDNSDQKIDYIHRETEKEDICFVSNSSLERQVARCRFRIGKGRMPGFWNAQDGSVKPSYAYGTKDGFTWITLDLAPASSIFVVFSEAEARDSIVENNHLLHAFEAGFCAASASAWEDQIPFPRPPVFAEVTTGRLFRLGQE